MTLTSVTQHNLLREQRLQFIRAHQNAFDVEPIFPLQLFEDFVGGVEGDCTIEASCKVEVDKLIASRFLLFFPNQTQSWTNKLAQSLKFFRQVESRADVRLNYDLLHKFLGNDFDFSKMTSFSTGIDLRKNLADSSLKMHIRIDNYPEKLATVLALDSSINPRILHKILLRFISGIGLDFYLDGTTNQQLLSESRNASICLGRRI